MPQTARPRTNIPRSESIPRLRNRHNSQAYKLLEKAPTAPKMIKESDLRPHTMKVKGKSNPNSVIMSKDPGVPSAESMMPHYGNFRNQKKGLLYPGVLHKSALDGPLKPRPDSAFGYLDTKFTQPK